MLLLPQLSPLPGPIDDLITRAALGLVDWFDSRLRRRAPTLASMPLPADPVRGFARRGGGSGGRATHQEAHERGGRHRP